jgi:hypothetical protein
MPARRRAHLLPVLAIIAGCTFGAPPESAPPEITPRPTPVPTPRPSQLAAASPTPAPTPALTPAPTLDPALLELDAVSCHGGVVLDWSPATDPRFHHYTALRSPVREIEPGYPPVAPAVDWGDSYTTDRFVTSAVDASLIPSQTLWYYRVMAYDARNRVVASSPVRAARLREPRGLGQLEVGAGPDGVTRLTWRTYGGEERCFSAYRVLAASGGGAPGTLAIVSDQATGTLETDALRSGTTYALTVHAVRTTTLGSFVLGETDTVTFTVP